MYNGGFAVGIYHPKSESNVGTLWRSAFSFGASMIFTIGRRYARQSSDTTQAWRKIPLVHYADVADLLAHLPHGWPLVGVELDARAKPLSRFTHPQSACYLLGAEDHGLSSQVRDACHRIVQIEGPSMCLNVAAAGTVLLYDRYVKTKSATEIPLPG
jgi:tRNA G18 (ribose-2'-O)-methylase SpoU